MNIVLSDYLEDAPDKVLSDTCKAIVKWSMGSRFVMPSSLSGLIRDPDFIVGSRPKYLDRCRTLTRSQQGCCRNLLDSVERLRDSGLITDDDFRNSYYTWATQMAKYRFGQCNQMFRVVSVNPVLDSYDVPEYVLDFVIYHETLHLRQDTSKNRRPHNAQFKGWERMFPQYDEAEECLRRLAAKMRR